MCETLSLVRAASGLALTDMVLALCTCLGAGQLTACSDNTEKSESATLLRVVSDLQQADNDRKRPQLERLRAVPCTKPEVCKARDACVDAFEHHVRGVELGQSLRVQLDAGGDRDPAALLLEMNVEVEAGRAAMPSCETGVASLRRKHKL